jgi:very-short-patch-repair endonuclease
MRQEVPPKHRDYARAMRKDATRAENMLWQALRGKQLEGLKFRRQVPLDGYIVDFICMQARLVIEVDGGQHSESIRDEVRDAHFSNAGFAVLRFWNHEVERNLEGVCQHILHVTKKL